MSKQPQLLASSLLASILAAAGLVGEIQLKGSYVMNILLISDLFFTNLALFPFKFFSFGNTISAPITSLLTLQVLSETIDNSHSHSFTNQS